MLSLLSCLTAETAIADTSGSALASAETRQVAAEVAKTDPALTCYRGHALRVRHNEDGELRSIGYRLFDDCMMERDSLEFDFLERYFLMLDATTPSAERKQRMADDKVRIVKGTESDLFRMAGAGIAKEKSRVDGKLKVTVKGVSQDGSVFSGVEFPISYELMMRCSRAELENELPQSLKLSSVSIEGCKAPNLEGVEPDSDGIYTCGGLSYYLESLTDQTYFKSVGKDGVAIFSNEDKQRSAANLLLGAVAEPRRLELIQKLYGFKDRRISTTVGQWLNYCKKNEMKLYFAVEKEAGDGVLALVIAVNSKLMYNHLLSVLIPHDFVNNPKSTLKGTLTTFIPTHNVDDLYEQRDMFKKKDLSKILK